MAPFDEFIAALDSRGGLFLARGVCEGCGEPLVGPSGWTARHRRCSADATRADVELDRLRRKWPATIAHLLGRTFERASRGSDALQHAQLAGVAVPPRLKRPATSRAVKDTTADARLIVAWWDQWPDANVAIATGARSGIFVLDVGEQSTRSLAALEAERGRLPLAAAVNTAAGKVHVYFRHPDGVRNSAGRPVYRGRLGGVIAEYMSVTRRAVSKRWPRNGGGRP